LYHNPEVKWIPLTKYNQWYDTAFFAQWPKPWTAGSYSWVIPVKWRIGDNGVERNLPNRLQVMTITGTNGASNVSKLGQSASRTPTP
jgi:hypothetical protein